MPIPVDVPALPKSAMSFAPGTVSGFQFVPVNQEVPPPLVPPSQVIVAACAFGARRKMIAIKIVTMKEMAKARLESVGSWRRFAVRLTEGSTTRDRVASFTVAGVLICRMVGD